MKSGGHLSIWFFTGICLGVNGFLIFVTGIYETMHPPANSRPRQCPTVNAVTP